MTNNAVIIRSSPFATHSPSYADMPQAGEEPPLKSQKIIHGYALPQIAIKNEPDFAKFTEVVLVNGCWDTSDAIPNIVAEMHSVEERKGAERPPVSPRGSDSGIEADCCADGSLAWLLNYKIHELPPVPDSGVGDGFVSVSEVIQRDEAITEFKTNQEQLTTINRDALNPLTTVQINHSTVKNSTYQYNTIHPASSQNVCGNGGSCVNGPKKPPFTYTELIEHALSEKGELTVSGIYQWISEHFPYYKQNDDRWKNSVRHNLSINPHFRKGSKAVHGAGHLWTIAQKDDKKSWQIKQRMEQFIQTTYKQNKSPEQEALDMELQLATASILGESFSNFEPGNEECNKNENIEVEFVNVIDIQNGLEDFLSPPVSKQQIVQECGLGNDFLITDLNPNALGLNLAENGEVINDGNFYDDISFEYYELEKE